ncbi:hypothetical protein BDK51DRAFT_32120, partial [Blyttiomyces helicus]
MKNTDFRKLSSPLPNQEDSLSEKHGYCDLCFRNYWDGKRHFYSKAHADSVARLLKKHFNSLQLDLSRLRLIPTPTSHTHTHTQKLKTLSAFRTTVCILRDPMKQPEIWCIFCSCDIRADMDLSKDLHVGCYHIFGHLADEAHIASVDSFFRKHRADASAKSSFIMDEAAFAKFQNKAKLALDEATRKLEIETPSDEGRAAAADIPAVQQLEPRGVGSESVYQSHAANFQILSASIDNASYPYPSIWDTERRDSEGGRFGQLGVDLPRNRSAGVGTTESLQKARVTVRAIGQ